MLGASLFARCDHEDEMYGWIIVLGLMCCTVSGNFIGDVRNVSIGVVAFDEAGTTILKLNVSWLPPETGKKPSFYR